VEGATVRPANPGHFPDSGSKKGLRALRNPLFLWLRGLDLNQRPLGYEGKFALHTAQKDPTGTNNDGDLRGDEVVPCWFDSVRLLHRDFIGGSESPCRSCPVHCVQHVHPSWRTAHGEVTVCVGNPLSQTKQSVFYVSPITSHLLELLHELSVTPVSVSGATRGCEAFSRMLSRHL
jgi:hypothetical protein